MLGFIASIGDRDLLTVETSRGAEQTISTTKYEVTGRGGKGRELLQRGQFTRIVPTAAARCPRSSSLGGHGESRHGARRTRRSRPMPRSHGEHGDLRVKRRGVTETRESRHLFLRVPRIVRGRICRSLRVSAAFRHAFSAVRGVPAP